MGEAKNIVGVEEDPPDTGTVIADLGNIIDRIDKAIEIKQQDLADEEGEECVNHFKLGILKAADALVRRAKAALEDYGYAFELDWPESESESGDDDEDETLDDDL